MKILTIIILLLIPAFAPAEEQRFIRDRSGSVLYEVDKYGNEIIYRNRAGDVIGSEVFHGSQRDRDQDYKAPLWDEE